MVRRICKTCKYYNSDNYYCKAGGDFKIYEEDTCEYWGDCNLTEEELEAQRVDAAERENHRQEVEGDIGSAK